jgi:hypothetical protein
MKTTIDNNQRKFIVQSQGWGTKDIICNLSDIPTVLKEGFEAHEEFKILEYWNRKLKVCSKKHINEMFIANEINFKIK